VPLSSFQVSSQVQKKKEGNGNKLPSPSTNNTTTKEGDKAKAH